MDQPRQASVELRLAEAGQELAAAIEAAQYARLIQHDPPAGPAATAAIEAFVAAFADAAERWDQLAPIQRAGLLARLGDHLDALEALGWYVHWRALRLGLARPSEGPLQLPLAILRVGRSSAPTLRVPIPRELAVDPGAGAVH